MARADFKFVHRLRVRYSEVDAQAVVFNARYLDYADLAIAEYFRVLGIPIVPGPGTPEFHTAKASVEYKAPIRLDEEVDLCVRATRIGRTSIAMTIEIHGTDRDALRASVELVYVHVDLKTGKSAPVPSWVVEAIERHAGEKLREA